MLLESNKVVEQEVQYNQIQVAPTCNITHKIEDCYIDVDIEIEKDMDAPIFFYYKLSNFYQNHRRYVKSRDDVQLSGEIVSDLSACEPLSEWGDKNLYPCGLIANSLFNDTFNATVYNGATKVRDLEGENWNGHGIAWSSDVQDKFKLREPTSDETALGPTGKKIWTESNNEDFIVWMRTAGLPTFKKLYRKIENFDLKAGQTLKLKILNTYPVDEFDGKKYVVLSTTSWIGGKNDFLGWAYIVVGVICLLLSAVFLIKDKVSPRELGDMKYFKW